jgi:uncharacterized membrane protein YdjX (TVP38/TMEM64 family)
MYGIVEKWIRVVGSIYQPVNFLKIAMNFIRQHARLIYVALFLLLLLIIFQWSGMRSTFTLSFIREQLSQHVYAGFFIFVLLFSLGNLIQIPGLIFLAAAVLTLGQVVGGLVAFLAAYVSCAVTFFLIRYLGGNALRKVNNRLLLAVLSRLDDHPLQSVLIARMLFQTAPVLNYVLAMSGIKTGHYLLGNLLGLPLPIALYCLFFDYLAKTMHII